MKRAAQQRGMAIISALLIAAVVAVIAGGMISRQSLFTRQLENQQWRAQSAWLLQGGLEWSRQVLREQRRADPLIRTGQPWSQPLAGPLAGARGGHFQGRLDDEQGKFNLRNLINNDQVDEQALAAFERLAQLIGIRPALAQQITERVIEGYPWRPAPQSEPVTASNSFASGRATSPSADRQPRPPRRPMLRSLDQLANLKGMDSASLARLRTFVTVLPANTWINGNTAPAEVLAAQVPGLSVERARHLVAERDGGRWIINRGDFVNRLQMPQVAAESVRVGINSDWFRLFGQARQAQGEVRLEALLRLHDRQLPTVIWAQVGT